MKIKNNTIEITKTFSQKASRVGSPEYYELLEVRHNFPKFKVVVNQTKSKDSFKGLTYEFMATYISKHNDSQNKLEIFKRMTATSDEDVAQVLKAKTYQEVKRWFLEVYPEILKCYDDREELLTGKTA